jgi:hypothetical protein
LRGVARRKTGSKEGNGWERKHEGETGEDGSEKNLGKSRVIQMNFFGHEKREIRASPAWRVSAVLT